MTGNLNGGLLAIIILQDHAIVCVNIKRLRYNMEATVKNLQTEPAKKGKI
jgi:hypothetical protein